MTILISKVNQLGDNVVFLPVVQGLRRLFPQARLIVATSPVARDLYTRCVPGAEVIMFKTTDFNGAWKRPWKLLPLAWKWRSFRPDAVLVGDDQGNVAHLLARASEAGLRIGPRLDLIRANGLLNHRVPLDLSRHVAEQNWGMARQLAELLGGTLPEQPPAPDLSGLINPTTPADTDIVIHAGASRAYKRWPLERYAQLANTLATSHRVTWIDQGDDHGLQPAVRRFKQGDLGSFVTLLAGARLFIGNNSGPMNIASALGTPSVIFNGPSTPNWDPAWHEEHFTLLTDPSLPCQPCDKLTHPVNACQNLREPMACMNRWSVEAVAAKALAVLAQDLRRR
ncbi:MAG: hypothetical protein JWO94_592 [Verrucomicrobiaceae bacterium]|nr:hypothetical protein [Verrucomicrobiaceae bacterium]